MLNAHVLVLNRSWVAIHIAPARRALNLLYLGLARAVHPAEYSLHGFEDWVELWQKEEDGRYVHTPRLRIRIPEVILLNHFNGFVLQERRFSRHSVFERDKNVCQYCGKSFGRSQLTIDHVIPQSRGGEDTWENLVVACTRCNVRKGSRTPQEAGMKLIRQPEAPPWLPRFGRRIPNDELDVWQQFVDTRSWLNPSTPQSAL